MNIRFAGVIGAGRSGRAAAALLRRQGAQVLLSDSGPITGKVPSGVQLEERGNTDRLLEADVIIRSPGVPNHLPVLRKANRRKMVIWSELELASRSIHPRWLIGITGTNGKTTTTTLVGALFKAAHRPTQVGGNIGTPLSDLVPKVTRSSAVVLEVSSYQLENIDRFHPTVAAILNITPDHLEHHGSMAAYIRAKARVFENQVARDVCVLNADDAGCRRLAPLCPSQVLLFSRTQRLKSGVFYDRGDVVIRWKRLDTRWPLITLLPGPHNIENILASVAIAIASGIPVSTIQRVLKRFRGVEHRLEPVRTLNGVRYINDSKGTNVDSTRVALASYKEPLIVIMGGEGKGAPYSPLIPLVKEKVRQLLLIGEDAGVIRRELRGAAPSEDLQTMDRAVRRARDIARPGDVVLLSPACASFDQYSNYEERGRHFKALVKGLK